MRDLALFSTQVVAAPGLTGTSGGSPHEAFGEGNEPATGAAAFILGSEATGAQPDGGDAHGTGATLCVPTDASHTTRAAALAAHLTERTDPVHPTDEGAWLEPYDGDVGAERDAWRHREDNWYWDEWR